MAEVIRVSTAGADSSSPPTMQKPARPHTEASSRKGELGARQPAEGSKPVKGSIPFDELRNPLADRCLWNEPSSLFEISGVGEGCRDVSRLQGKEILYRLSAQ